MIYIHENKLEEECEVSCSRALAGTKNDFSSDRVLKLPTQLDTKPIHRVIDIPVVPVKGSNTKFMTMVDCLLVLLSSTPGTFRLILQFLKLSAATLVFYGLYRVARIIHAELTSPIRHLPGPVNAHLFLGNLKDLSKDVSFELLHTLTYR